MLETRGVRLIAACLACLCLASSPTLAQKQTPIIFVASVSADGTVLFLEGSGFPASPTVTFGGVILGGVVVNSGGTSASASMPAVVPGSYLVTISSGNNKSAAFEVTLGATGPAGPIGPTGPPGAAGANGIDGATGPAGAAGPQGPTGPAGANGAMGLTGPAGANGAIGPAGPQGPQGPSDAFQKNTFAGNVALSNVPTDVATLTLGSGSYVFIASARLLSQGTGSNADCFIQPAGMGNSNFSNVNVGPAQDRKIVSLNYIATLTAASTAVSLRCEITTGDAVKADEIFFTAIKVATITPQ